MIKEKILDLPSGIKSVIINGKSPERVHSGYLPYPKDWAAQYNMLLMDGTTCSDCIHIKRCSTLFEQSPTSDSCQFHPNKFQPQKQNP